MASRILLNVDAKADKALREVERLREKLKQTNRQASGVSRNLSTGGAAMGALATQAAGMLSVATAVRGVLAEWNGLIERANQQTKTLVSGLRDFAGGGGNLQDIPQLRQFFANRQGTQTTAQDLAQAEAFKATAQGADLASIQRAVAQSEMAGVAYGQQNAQTFATVLGGITQAGVDQGRAADIAARLIQQTGGRAKTTGETFTRAINQLPGQEDALLRLSIANAQAGGSPEAVLQLIREYKSSGFTGSIDEWAQGADISRMGGETGARLTAIRGQLPSVTGQTAGWLARDYGTAMQDELTRTETDIARTERQRENIASRNIEYAQRVRGREARMNVSLDEQGIFSGFNAERFSSWYDYLDPTNYIMAGHESAQNNLRRLTRGATGGYSVTAEAQVDEMAAAFKEALGEFFGGPKTLKQNSDGGT